jgi:hypothetical protein
VSNLDKAISQTTLTRDTVQAQFCSDWLKEQMTALFDCIAELEWQVKRLTEIPEGSARLIADLERRVLAADVLADAIQGFTHRDDRLFTALKAYRESGKGEK